MQSVALVVVCLFRQLPLKNKSCGGASFINVFREERRPKPIARESTILEKQFGWLVMQESIKNGENFLSQLIIISWNVRQ